VPLQNLVLLSLGGVALLACNDGDEKNEIGPGCKPWETRVDGVCCDLECQGRSCGDNGCGTSCGTCLGQQACVEGQCVCQGLCDYPKNGRQWGLDGCGGICECGAGLVDMPDGHCCFPSCDGLECGNDGCGGSCGWCAGGVCVEGACEAAPLAPAALVRTLYLPMPGGSPDDAASCADVNGDGVGDNGAATMVGTLEGFGIDGNQELADGLESGGLRLALVGEDLDDRSGSPFVTVYLGAPNDATVMTATTSPLGEPLVPTSKALWTPEGTLLVGESVLTLPYRLRTEDVPLPVEHVTMLLAEIEASAAGWSIGNGTMSGLLYKADLDRWLYSARVWCATDPLSPADLCGYIQTADMSLVETFLTWDFDDEACGKRVQVYDADDPMIIVGTEENCQAVSVCFRFTANAGSVEAPKGGPAVIRLADDLTPDFGSAFSCGCRLSSTRNAMGASGPGVALLLVLAICAYRARRSL